MHNIISSNHVLYHQQIGDKKPQVLFIHGLLGSTRNWQIFLRILHHDCNITAAAVDLRGHGESPHFEKGREHFDVFVEDVQHWIQEKTSFPIALIGHSMGGKVAMCLAARFPHLINRLMIVDIPASPIAPDVENVIDWMQEVPTPNSDPDIAKQYLQKHTQDQRLVTFLLTNWKQTDRGWIWRVDMEGLQYISTQLKALQLEQEWQNIQAPITLVRGAYSEHFSEAQALQMIAAKPNHPIQYHILNKSGHWCQADEPQKFRAILKEFVK